MIDRPVSPTSDISLLLRAHAEQRWLSHEVLPVLRQLEQRDCLPEEQLGAALAYLEVLWIEASQRAAETDAAYSELQGSSLYAEPPLYGKARSYDGAPVGRDRHILGYNVDHTGSRLTERLAEFLADREQRTMRMAAALRELGFELDERDLQARIAAGQPIGRPHLAEAVLGSPAN